jgi:hypothetical protein
LSSFFFLSLTKPSFGLFWILALDYDYSKHIQFGVLSPQEIVNVSEFEVTQRDLYTVPERQPVKYGMLDLRLVRNIMASALLYQLGTLKPHPSIALLQGTCYFSW